MFIKSLLLIFSLFTFAVHCQEKRHPMALGLHYGFGAEIRNTDYTFTNHYFKPQLYWQISSSKQFVYEILLQPEINFARHRLINPYFVTPGEPDFEYKRKLYTRLKDIREYVLNIGLLIRKPISERFSVYVLGSIGPMLTDTETERLSKGFAFADVLALGLTMRTSKVAFDIRPNIRHTSNGGLQDSNAGFNTLNIEFGIAMPIASSGR